VSLLELRQDGGEEQTHRCRRRSTSPRLKRSKGRHSRFPPIKAQQKRQTAALSIKTRIETSKTMERRSWYKGVLESYAAHAPISERSSTSLPRSEHNELAEHIDKQGACPSSVRHVVQQARLCGSREILVYRLRSTQCPYPTWSRWSLQSGQKLPSTLRYEPGEIVAENDLVIVHGRYSGIGQPASWIVADIVRIKDGVLAEHWDVIQDEATRATSKSGLPMFGDKFME
jgi:hypothetical protein